MYSLKRFTRTLRASECGGDLSSDAEWPTRRDRLGPLSAGRDAWLNRLTVGPVVLGFLGFRQTLLWAEGPAPNWRFLARGEIAALERWQEDHDSGRLSTELFVCAVEALLGDRAPNKAFAGFGLLGSVLPRPPRNILTRRLGLNASQEREALAIYSQLHEEIRGWLTRAQLGIRSALGADEEALAAFLRQDAHPAPRGKANQLFGTLMEALRLAGEQQAKIAEECALLRSRVQQEHQIARSRFITLLTPTQWEVLQVIERIPPHSLDAWRKEDRSWSVE